MLDYKIEITESSVHFWGFRRGIERDFRFAEYPWLVIVAKMAALGYAATQEEQECLQYNYRAWIHRMQTNR